MPIYQIDWRSEFARLQPYLCGQGGIVYVRFRDENCAPNHFNALIKDRFHSPRNEGAGISIRIDSAWSTTITVDDILDEIDRKLEDGGYPAENAATRPSIGSILSELYAKRDINISISQSTLGSPRVDSRGRLQSACDRLRQMLGKNGRVMIELNDARRDGQARFWDQLWDGGLSGLVADGLVLIYMIGPKAGHAAWTTAPAPDLDLTLPSSFEAEDDRQDSVYDDLIELLERDCGLERSAASAAATAHLNATKKSVAGLHDGLTGLLLKLKQRSG